MTGIVAATSRHAAQRGLRLGVTLLLAAALVAWKLYTNKKTMAVDAELSQVTRAYVPVEVTTPILEDLANSLDAEGIFLPAKEMFVISERDLPTRGLVRTAFL